MKDLEQLLEGYCFRDDDEVILYMIEIAKKFGDPDEVPVLLPSNVVYLNMNEMSPMDCKAVWELCELDFISHGVISDDVHFIEATEELYGWLKFELEK